MRRFTALSIASAVVVAAACGLDVAGLDPLTPAGSVDAAAIDASGSSSGGDAVAAVTDGGAEASLEAGPPPCGPTRGGPAMIDVGGYCIDATEVTQAQYAAFLADMHAGYDAGTRPVCSWKSSKTSYDVPDKGTGVSCDFAPDKTPNVAVVCVDWCDADAFCRWAGKRLCGAIDGGAVAWSGDETIDAGRDAWYRACSKAGTRKYAYGTTADPSACSVSERALNRAADAGGFPKCAGGYDGLVDMNGNVDEHVDACQGTAGKNDRCRYRGGSWYWSAGESSCEHRYGEAEATRDARFADVGFRCCSR